MMLRFGEMLQPVKIGGKKNLTRLVRWFNRKGICHESLLICVWSLSSGGRRELNSTVSTHWLHTCCCRHSMIKHPFPVMQTQISVNRGRHVVNYSFIVKVFIEGLLHMPGGTVSDALEFVSWPLHKTIEHRITWPSGAPFYQCEKEWERPGLLEYRTKGKMSPIITWENR